MFVPDGRGGEEAPLPGRGGVPNFANFIKNQGKLYKKNFMYLSDFQNKIYIYINFICNFYKIFYN